MKVRGRFLCKKADLLVERLLSLLARPLKASLLPGHACGTGAGSGDAGEAPESGSQGAAPALRRTSSPAKQEPSGGGFVGSLGETDDPCCSKRCTQRVTLRDVHPTVWSLLRGFHRSEELSEPVAEEVVMLYRREDRPCPGAASRPDPGSPHPGARSPNIFLRRFLNVPLLDLEAVFPEKEMPLGTSPSVVLLAAVLPVLIAALAWAFSGSVPGALLAGCAGCAWACSSACSAGRRAEELLEREVSTRLLDSQEPLLLSLLEDMADQLFKQAVFVFFLLLRHRQRMVEVPRLVQEGDWFLQETFGCSIDFSVDVALEKLLKDEIICRREGRAAAVDLEEALEILEERDSRPFQSLKNEDEEAFADVILEESPEPSTVSEGELSEKQVTAKRTSRIMRVLKKNHLRLRLPSACKPIFESRAGSKVLVGTTSLRGVHSPRSAAVTRSHSSASHLSDLSRASVVSQHSISGTRTIRDEVDNAKQKRLRKKNLFKRVFNSPFS